MHSIILYLVKYNYLETYVRNIPFLLFLNLQFLLFLKRFLTRSVIDFLTCVVFLFIVFNFLILCSVERTAFNSLSDIIRVFKFFASDILMFFTSCFNSSYTWSSKTEKILKFCLISDKSTPFFNEKINRNILFCAQSIFLRSVLLPQP